MPGRARAQFVLHALESAAGHLKRSNVSSRRANFHFLFLLCLVCSLTFSPHRTRCTWWPFQMGGGRHLANWRHFVCPSLSFAPIALQSCLLVVPKALAGARFDIHFKQNLDTHRLYKHLHSIRPQPATPIVIVAIVVNRRLWKSP